MALITDPNIFTCEHLRELDSGIYETATVEGIDLEKKIGLAQAEAGMELMRLLGAGDPGWVRHVVVTELLRRWVLCRAIELAYLDAYGNHLNERYDRKARSFRQMSREAKQALLQCGVGWTCCPVPKAPRPTVRATPVPGGGGNYCIRIAWVNTRNEEGCASDVAVLAAGVDEGPCVSVERVPDGVIGWNVFVGKTPEACEMQNLQPLKPWENWTVPASGLVRGRPAGDGQRPEFYRRLENRINRG